MATLTYNYTPDQNVWVINKNGTCLPAVVSGKIIQFKPIVNLTSTTKLYDVRLKNENGVTQFLEAEIFATLSDALLEYENVVIQ